MTTQPTLRQMINAKLAQINDARARINTALQAVSVTDAELEQYRLELRAIIADLSPALEAELFQE